MVLVFDFPVACLLSLFLGLGLLVFCYLDSGFVLVWVTWLFTLVLFCCFTTTCGQIVWFGFDCCFSALCVFCSVLCGGFDLWCVCLICDYLFA